MNITIETSVHAPIEKVWAAYATPATMFNRFDVDLQC